MLLLPYLTPHIMVYHLHLALVNITNHLGSGNCLPVHWRSLVSHPWITKPEFWNSLCAVCCAAGITLGEHSEKVGDTKGVSFSLSAQLPDLPGGFQEDAHPLLLQPLLDCNWKPQARTANQPLEPPKTIAIKNYFFFFLTLSLDSLLCSHKYLKQER